MLGYREEELIGQTYKLVTLPEDVDRQQVHDSRLRAGLTEWFTFYNGYDPLFTWWMGLPYKRADAALQAYATLLRDKVAAADLATTDVPSNAMTWDGTIPKNGSVTITVNATVKSMAAVGATVSVQLHPDDTMVVPEGR